VRKPNNTSPQLTSAVTQPHQNPHVAYNQQNLNVRVPRSPQFVAAAAPTPTNLAIGGVAYTNARSLPQIPAQLFAPHDGVVDARQPQQAHDTGSRDVSNSVSPLNGPKVYRAGTHVYSFQELQQKSLEQKLAQEAQRPPVSQPIFVPPEISSAPPFALPPGGFGGLGTTSSHPPSPSGGGPPRFSLPPSDKF
jgi:hypothetical protein